MIAQASELTSESISRFRFEAAPHPWITFLVLIPVLLLLAWGLYRNLTGGAGRGRWALVLLRAGALLLLLLAIFKPIRETIRTREVQDQILVLLDDSASMGRVDGYTDQRIYTALAEVAGLEGTERPDTLSRLELARRALERPAGLLEGLRRRFDVLLFSFSSDLTPVAGLGALEASGRVTRLGEALRSGLPEALGGRPAGVAVFSDGRNNDGLSALDAAAAYAAEGIPIHTILCGQAQEPRNAAVLGIQAPGSTLAREEVPFRVGLHSQGLPDQPFRLSLVRLPDGEVLETRESRFFTGGGEQAETLTYRFDEPGLYTLELRVDPLPGESFLDDNAAVHHLVVHASRIRVLYIEDYPRFEYHYLKNTLLRADQAIEAQCLLFKADADFIQEATRGLPHLTDLPRTRKTLFQDYAVVVLGDVDPELFGRTPREREDFLRLLKEFTEFGGGLIFQAGAHSSPDSYRGTPLEDLLPVVLADPEEKMSRPWDTSVRFQPVLENIASPHQVLKLLPNPETNRLLWTEGLEGFYWYAPVRRAKAGASVLLRHPEQRNKYGRHVLAASWDYGQGRTLFLGLDSLWRWRKYYGDTHFDTFWRNSIRFAAEGRLRRGSDRASIDLDKRTFEVGERIPVTLRLFDEEFVPSTETTTRLAITLPDGERREATLSADPTEAGTFRGTFRFQTPGSYSLSVHEGGQLEETALARVGLRVSIPERELADPTPDPLLMTRIARETGGSALTLGEAEKLLGALPSGGKQIVSVGKDPRPEQLWDTPWLLFLLMLLLGAEWVLRKAVHLP